MMLLSTGQDAINHAPAARPHLQYTRLPIERLSRPGLQFFPQRVRALQEWNVIGMFEVRLPD